MGSPSPGRRLFFIDWLKVLVVLGIFYYHAAMPFAYSSWMIVNVQKSAALSIYAVIGYQFGIPLLFVIAGANGWLSLGVRGAVRFVRERFWRLLVPLGVGIVLLSPIQSYFMVVNHGRYSGSFLSYIPVFFRGIEFYLNPTWFGNYGYHLWFLAFLFLYSLAAVPIDTWLRSPAARHWIDIAATASQQPGGVFLAVIPVALVQMAFKARFPAYQDWADLVYWLVLFLCGALLVSDPRITAAVKAQGGRALLWTLGVGLILLPLAAAGLIGGWEARPTYSPGYFFYQALRSLFTYGWVLICLNIGLRWLDFGNRFLTYANEAVMPFYVIHHPVIVVIAFYVVQWQAGVWTKNVFLVVTALAVTIAIYELVIRPFDPVRAIFGLKPKRRPLPRDGSATAASTRVAA
ncbi:MAG TPA: acyltransferase family protein [Candidatus Dormibacteraeota bacterium]|nr:acyltransferase family protein [Candidatus Dormibacteraeota bacterium]